MLIVPKSQEKERFKKIFADELLVYHFERMVGKNENNNRHWRTLVEENVAPHIEILCDLSQWLLERGWSRAVVEECFFVVADEGKDTS